jgi:hypothetical protein
VGVVTDTIRELIPASGVAVAIRRVSGSSPAIAPQPSLVHAADPDFKHEDLQRLILAASDIADVLPLQAMPNQKVSFRKLKFCTHVVGEI